MSFVASEYIGPPAFTADGSVWAPFVSGGKGLAARLVVPPPSAPAQN
jgi:hypothetical protein